MSDRPRQFFGKLLQSINTKVTRGAIALVGLMAVSSCTRQLPYPIGTLKETPLPSSPFQLLSAHLPSNPLLPGTPPFSFDPKQVTELTIVKSDPTSDDHWIAVFKPALDQEEDHWEIASSPPEQPILDRRANGTFLLHLLNAIQSIRILHPAPHGALDSFGLNPPQYAIRWKTPEQDLEFQLGSELKDHSGSYFTMDRDQIFIATGAAFKMLHLIDSFPYLRQKKWSALSIDDIEQVELRYFGRSIFYAQRDGTVWTDQKHHPIRRNTEFFLTQLTTTHVRSFVDNPTQTERLKKSIQIQPFYEAITTDRFGRSTRFQIKLQDGIVYGLTSSRPSGVFQIDPRIYELFRKQGS